MSDAIIKLVREITSEFNSIPTAIHGCSQDRFLSLQPSEAFGLGEKEPPAGGPDCFLVFPARCLLRCAPWPRMRKQKNYRTRRKKASDVCALETPKVLTIHLSFPHSAHGPTRGCCDKPRKSRVSGKNPRRIWRNALA